MNKIIKLLSIALISFLFISCVEEEPLAYNQFDLTVMVNYKGSKEVEKVNFLLFDFEKGITSEPIATYSSDGVVTFPTLFRVPKVKSGEYIALVYGDTDLTDNLDRNSDNDPVFITEKIVVDMDKDLSYTIISNDECNPNNCQNGGVCTKISDTEYSCACLDGFSGDNCEIKDDRNLSCLDNHCTRSTDCDCDADYCIPSTGYHTGVKASVCTFKGCRGNESICPEGTVCIDSHYGDSKSFCATEDDKTGVGEVEFLVTYNGSKHIKKLGVGFFTSNRYRGIPPFAAAATEENFTFPYSFKVIPTSTGKFYIWLYGDMNGDLFPDSNEPDYKGEVTVTSTAQVVEIEIKD